MIVLPVTPVPKPRMTQRDRWKKRPCTDRYWAYKDSLKNLFSAAQLPAAYHLIFVMPMPATWSKKKRAAMVGQPHQQKPDKDNLEKGFLDALFDDDAGIWDGRVSKIWGSEGTILIKPIVAFELEHLQHGAIVTTTHSPAIGRLTAINAELKSGNVPVDRVWAMIGEIIESEHFRQANVSEILSNQLKTAQARADPGD